MTFPNNTRITADHLRSLVHYNPLTGEFTYLRRDGESGAVRRFNSMYAGKPAGCIHTTGYHILKLNNETYPAHRLAWLYIHGEFPPQFIDHRNGVRSDNRLINLRPASRAQNAQNAKGRKSEGNPLPKHVSYDKRYGSYFVRIRSNGKLHRCGYFDDLSEASVVALEQAKLLQGEFARLP